MSDTVMLVDDGAMSKEDVSYSNNNDNKMDLEESGETWSNMILKKLLRPARYFDPPDEASPMTDSSCEEQEHTKPPRKRCFLCASFDHVGEHCSKGHDSCPNDGSICLRCGGMGHDMSLCKYEYTKDDMKDVRCYVCKRFGHMCCVEPCDSLSWAVSCYKCGKVGHVGLGCGRHYEERPECWGKRHCSSRLAEKKRRRLEKALATSAAIRDRLEKKKQKKLEEQQQQQQSTLDGGNFEEGSSSHQSKNDGKLEQHSTLHESNGKKKKKDNVESEESFTKEEEEDERPQVAEKSNHRSGWITEDLVVGQHQEAEYSH